MISGRYSVGDPPGDGSELLVELLEDCLVGVDPITDVVRFVGPTQRMNTK